MREARAKRAEQKQRLTSFLRDAKRLAQCAREFSASLALNKGVRVARCKIQPLFALQFTAQLILGAVSEALEVGVGREGGAKLTPSSGDVGCQ